MAKAKYITDNSGNKIYPIGHTKAIYDNNGVVLEDKLNNISSASNTYTDTKIGELVGGAPETLDTIAEVAQAIQDNETVVDALNNAIGTKANKTDVDAALTNKLDVDGDASDTTVDFTEATERTDIITGEKVSTIFGKIKKWCSDLKSVAFTGEYNDLAGTPTNATTSTSGLMSSADKAKLNGIDEGAQVNSVTGIKGDNENSYRTGNINITKTNIGLANVDNTSDADKPISKATQEALDTLRSQIGSGGSAIDVDSSLSLTSTNPVQNKVVASKLVEIQNDIVKIHVSATEPVMEVGDLWFRIAP